MATSKVLLYCGGLYTTSDLATSWMVNYYASVIAARMLCMRRVNPTPESLMEAYGEVIQDLKDIKAMRLAFNEIGLRNAAWPAWSNVRVDCRYRLRQTRVERPICEKTPTDYAQNIDQVAERTIEI